MAEPAVLVVRIPWWRIAVLRYAIGLVRVAAWIAARSGLGVSLTVHTEPPRCPCGRTIGNGYTCRVCTP